MRIEFGRALCGDLETAERREWLTTNGLGGFASGTIAGTLTRRYHGWLIAALDPPLQRTLLATKIDETVRYRDADYDLATNRWRDAYVAPSGYTAILRFYLDGDAPVWEYAVADGVLEKRVWLEPGANTAYATYRFLRGDRPMDVTLRAFVNYRSMHANTHAGDWRIAIGAESPRRVRVDAFPGARPYWIAADGGTLTVENVWYRNYLLAEETQRGLDDYDDNLAACSLTATLQPHDALTLVASDSQPDIWSSADALQRRHAYDAGVLAAHRRIAGDDSPPFLERCALAADRFVVRRPLPDDPGGLSIVAGYHWFSDWGRDTAIALPGLTLCTGRPDVARKILTTYAHFVDRGMLPNVFGADSRVQYNTVDAALWFVEAAARYANASGDRATVLALWPALQSIVSHYRTGTRFGIRVDDDGLLTAGASGTQLTWMDAKIGDWAVTPRAGKSVEVCALWYNALLRLAVLREAHDVPGDATDYAGFAARTRDAFARFWNDPAHGCFDVLDGPGGNDATIRPNQIFAVALPHCPLDEAQSRAVVDVCAARLLTSRGLRSLAPSDSRFVARYAGSPQQRDAAYHQGTVWTWLLGAFAVAHARTYGDVALARSFLTPLEGALCDYGLGTLGEIADGAAPFEPRGAIAQAWSVAELLRAWHDIPLAAEGRLETC